MFVYLKKGVYLCNNADIILLWTELCISPNFCVEALFST